MANTQLSLPEAQEEILNTIRRLDKHNLRKLIEWVQWNWREECLDEDSPEEILKSIAMDIRVNVPLEAVLPSEKIVPPSVGPNADCNPEHTRHVDAFLYDHEMVSELVSKGSMISHYCTDCGSINAKPLTFISHSASREQISHIFNVVLPPVENKTLLDVGSRLGAILYGAYLYTKAAKIYGVEVNGELCRIQREVIMKYGFQDRIEIVNSGIEHKTDLLASADVIVLNNVFEFFMDRNDQVNVWQVIHKNVKHGAYLITIPSLEKALENLPGSGIDVDSWVQELDVYNMDAPGMPTDDPELSSIHLYEVK